MLIFRGVSEVTLQFINLFSLDNLRFDSWFYPKDGKVDPGGGGGAVINWTDVGFWCFFVAFCAGDPGCVCESLVVSNQGRCFQVFFLSHDHTNTCLISYDIFSHLLLYNLI